MYECECFMKCYRKMCINRVAERKANALPSLLLQLHRTIAKNWREPHNFHMVFFLSPFATKIHSNLNRWTMTCRDVKNKTLRLDSIGSTFHVEFEKRVREWVQKGDENGNTKPKENLLRLLFIVISMYGFCSAHTNHIQHEQAKHTHTRPPARIHHYCTVFMKIHKYVRFYFLQIKNLN